MVTKRGITIVRLPVGSCQNKETCQPIRVFEITHSMGLKTSRAVLPGTPT